MSKREMAVLSVRKALPGIANSGIDEFIASLNTETEVEYGAFLDIVDRLYDVKSGGDIAERITAAKVTISRAIDGLPNGLIPRTEVEWKKAARILYRFTPVDDKLVEEARTHAVTLAEQWNDEPPALDQKHPLRVAVVRLLAGEKATLKKSKRTVDRITERLYNELANALAKLAQEPTTPDVPTTSRIQVRPPASPPDQCATAAAEGSDSERPGHSVQSREVLGERTEPDLGIRNEFGIQRTFTLYFSPEDQAATSKIRWQLTYELENTGNDVIALSDIEPTFPRSYYPDGSSARLVRLEAAAFMTVFANLADWATGSAIKDPHERSNFYFSRRDRLPILLPPGSRKTVVFEQQFEFQVRDQVAHFKDSQQMATFLGPYLSMVDESGHLKPAALLLPCHITTTRGESARNIAHLVALSGSELPTPSAHELNSMMSERELGAMW